MIVFKPAAGILYVNLLEEDDYQKVGSEALAEAGTGCWNRSSGCDKLFLCVWICWLWAVMSRTENVCVVGGSSSFARSAG